MTDISDGLFQLEVPPAPPAQPQRHVLSSGVRDNDRRGTVADFLRENLAPGSEVSIVSAYFTIYAYQALKQELDSIKELRFLYGDPTAIASVDPDRTDKKTFHIENDHIQLTHKLNQKQIARECADWMRNKVEIKSVRRNRLLHGKMYHIRVQRVDSAILGSSNFTARGIGVQQNSNLELNLIVDANRDRQDLKQWFDELWNDHGFVEDVKHEVLQYLAQIYTDPAPEFVYYKTLYHIFEKYLTSNAGNTQLFEQIQIIDTEIWKALFDFQKDGVKGAVNKINAYNGCILADSVGLGKTYTALAVIKYFELRNCRVLVLCPKKLRDNWTQFLATNNSEINPFLRDKFSYTVLSHTDLSRDSGMTGDINLANLNWGNYDLVVVDESHNFRNNTKGRTDENGQTIRLSRYERLMSDIITKGIQTRVLLLSATPVNNNLGDLRNQIRFISRGSDTAFDQNIGVHNLSDTLNAAQKVFTKWSAQSGDKNAHHLIETLPATLFTLLDELTIARSRKHIRRYYAESMVRIGEFPKRKKPRSISTPIDLAGQFLPYDALNDEILKYQLSLFKPSTYILPEHKPLYAGKVGNFTQEDREKFLIGMMKVNFLKRLESSVSSFAVTMDRTVKKIEELQERLRAFQLHQASEQSIVESESTSDEAAEDDDLASAFEVGKALRFKMQHLDVATWINDLEKDRLQLRLLHDQAVQVSVDRDAKFAALKNVVREKISHPSKNKIGERVGKVVVFTAFADTAAYLYENLVTWTREELNVHIALVSGGARPNRTTLGRDDFSQILINFAPRAKNRAKMPSMPQTEEISILIATDCISEGQNLQDSDLLVNYDIHWNPVRIIQRFGRIDRIGSLNREIELVNFWPTNDLNKYINLKTRVEARMALVDISATAEDNLLAASEIEDLVKDELKYRDRQLLRLQKEILDLDDFNETVDLTDFTLDDFRIALLNYITANKRALEDAPMGLYTVVPAPSKGNNMRPGVVFCLKHIQGSERAERINPLQPYYLVYIYDTGDVRYGFGQPKQILEIFRELCAGRQGAYSTLCAQFDASTANGDDMSVPSDLLNKAIQLIAQQFNNRSLKSLLTDRTTKLTEAAKRPGKADDFELVTWLVIRNETSAK